MWREHRRVRRLLPWSVNGTLDPLERAVVDSHLARCEPCRRELAAEGRLAAALARRPAPEVAPHPARIAGLLRRIDAESGGRRRVRSIALPGPRSLWVVAGIQAAAVLLIAVLFLLDRVGPGAVPPAEFRTLAEPSEAPAAAAAPRLRLVFAPTLSEGGIRALLESVEGRIVDGPTTLGVYTVELPAGSGESELAAALARLREHPEVRFVEPAAAAR